MGSVEQRITTKAGHPSHNRFVVLSEPVTSATIMIDECRNEYHAENVSKEGALYSANCICKMISRQVNLFWPVLCGTEAKQTRFWRNITLLSLGLNNHRKEMFSLHAILHTYSAIHLVLFQQKRKKSLEWFYFYPVKHFSENQETKCMKSSSNSTSCCSEVNNRIFLDFGKVKAVNMNNSKT